MREANEAESSISPRCAFSRSCSTLSPPGSLSRRAMKAEVSNRYLLAIMRPTTLVLRLFALSFATPFFHQSFRQPTARKEAMTFVGGLKHSLRFWRRWRFATCRQTVDRFAKFTDVGRR